MGRIVIITGPPGTGKTTIASLLAETSHVEKSVLMHTDDFFGYVRRGRIPPYLRESEAQNRVVMEAVLAAAERYAGGGYEVWVDGIIGPWFLGPWMNAVRDGYEVHYVVLRANKRETLRRAIERSKLDEKTNTELVEIMWEQFAHLRTYEANVIDTTHCSVLETVSAVEEHIEKNAYVLQYEDI